MSGTYAHQCSYREQVFKRPVEAGFQRCTRCLKVRSEAEFVNFCPRTPGGRSKACADCRAWSRQYIRDGRGKYTEEQRLRYIARAKRLRDGRKKKVLDAYGGQCACCGISDQEFLTIDHIVKIGSKKRKENGDAGDGFYSNIIKRNFPDDYRCLCWNCNWSYGCYGYCPHQGKELVNV
jgi:hypothetical protein